MDIGKGSFCTEHMLSEQVARQVFEIQPENGPVIIVLDRGGNCWASDTEKFSKLSIDSTLLSELCAKIDDGAEPVISYVNNCCFVATQLVTERTNCGYVILAFSQCCPETAMASMDLIEMLLGQIGLIAKLTEKNNQLSEIRMRQFSQYCCCETALN